MENDVVKNGDVDEAVDLNLCGRVDEANCLCGKLTHVAVEWREESCIWVLAACR